MQDPERVLTVQYLAEQIGELRDQLARLEEDVGQEGLANVAAQVERLRLDADALVAQELELLAPDAGKEPLRLDDLGRQGEALARVQAELKELRDSYYLSDVDERLDVRELDGFADVAQSVMSSGRASMNHDRLYTLWQAVEAAPDGPPLIEIGSYRGGSARFIADSLLAAGRSPKFYLCDTFSGHPRTHEEYDTAHRDVNKFDDTSAEEVRRFLVDYPSLEVVVGDIVETAPKLGEDVFGFVHVDVDVFPATDFCLRHFAPRLAPGAMLVIDDYGFTTCPGAKRAADDFIDEFPEFRLRHLLTGQAIVTRR
jgi:O-methyltransferase